MIERRAFILGSALAVGLTRTQSATARRIGILGLSGWDPDDETARAFTDELRRQGFRVNEEVLLIERSGKSRELLAQRVAELLALRVEVIVTTASWAVTAARRASTTIPIVMLASGEPVLFGEVSGLARPGANVTGSTYFAQELESKQLQLLIESLGSPKRLAYVIGAQVKTDHIARLEDAARLRGVELRTVKVGDGITAESAIDALGKDRFEGLIMTTTNAYAGTEPVQAAKAMLRNQIAGIGTWRWEAEAGLPMTYGVDLGELARNAAVYVAKILRGARPEDLPVQGPTRLQFIVNLGSVNALRMKIPPAVLLRADEVIGR